MNNFVEGSEQNHRILDVNKTREMMIDFRPTQPLQILLGGVKDYKYLEMVISNRLQWKSNTDVVCKTGTWCDVWFPRPWHCQNDRRLEG